MQRIAVLRGIAVLALVSLGACDTTRSPTATEPAASPHFNTNPAPAPTVTNSGGYPLISWSALAGASSYSIVLRKVRTEIDKATFASQSQTYDYPLGSTEGTSFLDTANTYTGKSSCTSYGTYKTVILMYTYRVTATFPDGTTTGTVAAPVAPC
ncbi:MAG TPA: hypothetical protein VFQ76_17565 [Longimicrobiaceae bacterium]|nr:hypothetical protein [Longimicrobiaceae bacterium]